MVDEVHLLKKRSSKTRTILQPFTCPRLLLTATPVSTMACEDVFSMLLFLAPEFFGLLKLEKFALETLLQDKKINDALVTVCFSFQLIFLVCLIFYCF